MAKQIVVIAHHHDQPPCETKALVTERVAVFARDATLEQVVGWAKDNPQEIYRGILTRLELKEIE